jgi:cell wall-associated NlpC family hydrolase
VVTYIQLLNAVPSKLKESADAWDRWASAVKDHADQLDSVNKNVSTRWQGLAAKQAQAYISDAHVRVSESVGPLRGVRDCLNTAYTKFDQAHNDLLQARAAAYKAGLEVNGSGKVIVPDKMMAMANGHDTLSLLQQQSNIQARIDKAIHDATAADADTASKLKGLIPHHSSLAGSPHHSSLAGSPSHTGLAGSPGSGHGPSSVSPAAPLDYSRSGNFKMPPDAINNAPNPRAKKVLAFAERQLKKPYVWGATGPDSFDCSGLTSQAYQAAGITIPRTSEAQWSHGPRIPNGAEQRGDLVFFHMGPKGPGHVGIVVDPQAGKMIVAPRTGEVVQIQSYSNYPGGVVGFTRPGGGIPFYRP